MDCREMGRGGVEGKVEMENKWKPLSATKKGASARPGKPHSVH